MNTYKYRVAAPIPELQAEPYDVLVIDMAEAGSALQLARRLDEETILVRKYRDDRAPLLGLYAASLEALEDAPPVATVLDELGAPRYGHLRLLK